MKNRIKILLLIFLTLSFLSACQKDNKDNKDNSRQIPKESLLSSEDTENQDDKEDNKEDKKEDKLDKINESEEIEAPKPPGPKTKAGAVAGSCSTAWVEDREIFKKISQPEYKSENGYIYKAKDIKIPRLLIDSEDSQKINQYLDELEKKSIQIFEKFIVKEAYEIGFSEYYIFDDDEVLSILLYHNLSEDNEFYKYENFTFDLKTGKLLNDEELAKRFKIDNLKAIIEENIIRAAIDDTFFPDGPFTFRRFAAESLIPFWDEKDKNYLYIDSTGKLSLNYIIITNYGLGYRPITAPMDLPIQIDDKEINPLFTMMSNLIGNKKIPEDKIAYILYLGKADEETGIKTILTNLEHLIFDFGYYQPPELLVRYSEEPDNFMVEADEYFLIVPKYKNAIIYQEMIDESGEVIESEKETTYTIEYALSLQNIYDKANANINIRNRDDIFTFTPSIVDGKVQVPKEVEDISFILEESPITEYSGYPELYNLILNLIPKG